MSGIELRKAMDIFESLNPCGESCQGSILAERGGGRRDGG